jgi:hypothetical protein
MPDGMTVDLETAHQQNRVEPMTVWTGWPRCRIKVLRA